MPFLQELKHKEFKNKYRIKAIINKELLIKNIGPLVYKRNQQQKILFGSSTSLAIINFNMHRIEYC